MRMKVYYVIILFIGFIVSSCTANAGKTEATLTVNSHKEQKAEMPTFNADSAYNYVKSQVDFGPRVPGTDGHFKCAQYLVSELHRHGADTVIEQKTIVTAHNGNKLPINNIFAQYNPEANRRILLLAHWDTRPWADAEKDKSLHNTPIAGANDGASGVGVLLEIARNLNTQRPNIGVDILFTDAEDYGLSDGTIESESTWCLGTQYWTKNMPYKIGCYPEYGILLDIVGGINARFHHEYYSIRYAPSIVEKVWSIAEMCGYGKIFINSTGGAITDDHVYINRAGIPCIDIIENNNVVTGSFPPTWHTLADNINNIDRNSLKAVGETVLQTIYMEQP